MVRFTRHLVSKYFGRVIATVNLDATSHGVVCLAVEPPPKPTFRFSFSLDAIRQLLNDNGSWAEMVVRLAVAQAHKLYAKHIVPSDDHLVPLAVHIHPWIGDLLPAPYGGATHGVELSTQ